MLAAYQREQLSSGIVNTVQGFTNLIQCFQFSGLLSTNVMALQGSITAAYFGLVAINGAMYYITGKTLDELREVLKQIDQLEEKLCGILHTVHSAEDWIDCNNE